MAKWRQQKWKRQHIIGRQAQYRGSSYGGGQTWRIHVGGGVHGGDADGRCVVETEATDETKSSGAAVAADYSKGSSGLTSRGNNI